MWKVKRLYTSDFVAGIPGTDARKFADDLEYWFFSEDQVRNTVVHSPNGTFKSTLLSLIFTVFRPSARRFVQTLQSDGGKRLRDYLLPGRPALVMLELVYEGEQSDFFGDRQKTLVLGSTFMLRPAASGSDRTEFEPERVFFSAEKTNSFEQIRDNYRVYRQSPGAEKNILNTLKDIASTETIQRSWTQTLERFGLDPFIIDRQIDFARSEGGITESLKFSTEKQFVSYFLRSTMDEGRGSSLHKNILLAIDKNRALPERKRDWEHIQRIAGLLDDYELVAKDWRYIAEKDAAISRLLSEGHYYLTNAKPAVLERKAKVSDELSSVEVEAGNVERLCHIAIANKYHLYVKRDQLRVSANKHNADKVKQCIENTQAEVTNIYGSLVLTDVDVAMEAYTTVSTAFNEASETLQPIKDAITVAQQQYHARRRSDISEIDISINDAKDQESKLIEWLESLRKEYKVSNKQLQEQLQKQARLSDRCEAAEDARNSLPLQEGETPEVALERCHQGIEELKNEARELEKAASVIIEKIQNTNQSRTDEETLGNKLLAEQETLIKWLENEAADASALTINPLLCTLAGGAEFDPYSPKVKEIVKDTANREAASLTAQQRHSATLQTKLDELDGVTSLADKEAAELVAYFTELGVSESKVRTFPEYLDSVYDSDVEVIGRMMASDPARFTGLFCTDGSVIEQLNSLEPPSWLTKPVVISTAAGIGDAARLHENLIEPADPAVYSPNAVKERIEQISANLAESQRQEGVIAQRLHSLREIADALQTFTRTYVGKEERKTKKSRRGIVKELIEQSSARVEMLSQTLQQLYDDQSDNNDDIKRLEYVAGQLREDKVRFDVWLSQYGELENWLDMQTEVKVQVERLSSEIQNLDVKLTEGGGHKERISQEIVQYEAQKKALIRTNIVPEPDQEPSEDMAQTNLSLGDLANKYLDAQRLLTQASTEKGISVLEDKLVQASKSLTDKQNRWADFTSSNSIDDARIQYFRSTDIYKRRSVVKGLESDLSQLNVDLASLYETIKRLQQDLESNQKKLNGFMCKHQVEPSSELLMDSEEAINESLVMVSADHQKAEKEHQRLLDSSKRLAEALRGYADFLTVLERTGARVETYSPLEPEDFSTRPGFFSGTVVERTQSAEEFDKKITNLQSEMRIVKQQSKQTKHHLESRFTKLTAKLDPEDPSLQDMVTRLLSTDAVSMAFQCEEFIASCESVKRNLELELNTLSAQVDSLIVSLIDHATDCWQVLLDSVSITVPSSIPTYAGQPIVKMRRRLNFNKHSDVYHQALVSWFSEIVEGLPIPQSNAKTGDELGASLLYRLLSVTVSAKTLNTKHSEFGFEWIKPAGHIGHYEPVTIDTSSGGEKLTTATLLFCIICTLRDRQRLHQDNPSKVNFLFLDNPFGKSNKATLVQAQVEVCVAFNIQLIAFTGINDIQSLNLFTHKISLTSDNKERGDNMQIGQNWFYRLRLNHQSILEAAC